MNICSAKIQCSISEPMEKGRKKGKQTERARCKRTKNMSAKSILRKNFNDQEPPDLLVFGYQSKLYRDDVKALEFDRESHLIPAPYSSRELISRFVNFIVSFFTLIKLICAMSIIPSTFRVMIDISM